VVESIASTTTRTGLMVRCELGPRDYPKGIKVTDEEMMTLNIRGRHTSSRKELYDLTQTADLKR
jgi:hypothetical protein